jgi:hypothetical protein
LSPKITPKETNNNTQMLSVSNCGMLAVAALLPANTKTSTVTIQHPTIHEPLLISIPSCFDEAAKQSQHKFHWFMDLDAAEAEQNLPQVNSTIQKKGTENPFVRGLQWSNDGQYIAVTLESYCFLLYHITVIDNKLSSTLTTLIGFPRHLTFSTMTPNGKNWLIIDSAGDIYACSHAKIITGDVTQKQTLLFSINTACTQLLTITTADNNEYLIVADSEGKTRVSKLPHFFDIQSYLMANPSAPTQLIQLKTSNNGIIQGSNITITASPGGYERERVSDPECGFLPYNPLSASILIHNMINAELLLEPYRINHDGIWSDELVTKFSGVGYFGLGSIYEYNKTEKTNITTLFASPTLVSCELDSRGHLVPSLPLVYRSRIDQLVGIVLKYENDSDKIVPTIINKDIKVNNLPNHFNPQYDLIHRITPTQSQDKFIIHTVSNKVLILEKGTNGGLELNVIQCYDYSEQLLDENKALPKCEIFQHRWENGQLVVAKRINFHWRFERAPSRRDAQKRAHLTAALKQSDDVDNNNPNVNDEEQDPNELVQLGQ